MPPDPSDDNFDYESLIAGTYSDTELSALLTELAKAAAELEKYYFMIPEYQAEIDETLSKFKSFRPEEFTPDVRAYIVRIIAKIKEMTAKCKERNESNVLTHYKHLNYLKTRIKDDPDYFQKKVKEWEQKLQELPDSARILKESYSLDHGVAAD